MSPVDMVPLSAAAAILDVGAEQIRRYIRRGLLPADKVGAVWLTPAAHVRALQFGPPRPGRPLTAPAAWESIRDGDIDIDDPWRHANRGEISRWTGTPGAIADLLCRHDVVVSGVHAAHVHGALLDPLPDEAQIYVAQPALSEYPECAGVGGLPGLVRSGLGAVVVRAVPAAAWPQAVAVSRHAEEPARLPFGSPLTRYVSCAAVALDLAVSPHPREQDVAAALAQQR